MPIISSRSSGVVSKPPIDPGRASHSCSKDQFEVKKERTESLEFCMNILVPSFDQESELMSEASQMLQKMKDMPGMSNIGKMFGDMGMPDIPGLNKKSKINVTAMKSQLERNIKNAKMKEGLLKKSEERKVQEKQNMINEKLIQEKQSKYEKEYSEEAMEELYKIIGNSKEENVKTGTPNKNKKKKNKNKK